MCRPLGYFQYHDKWHFLLTAAHLMAVAGSIQLRYLAANRPLIGALIAAAQCVNKRGKHPVLAAKSPIHHFAKERHGTARLNLQRLFLPLQGHN